MDEREIAGLGSAYRAEVTRLFSFLVDEFGFEEPIDAGGEYSHALAYEHPGRNLTVIVANAFHPVDYGFEITLHPADGPKHGDSRDIVFFTLKEDQDRDFQFLVPGASKLREALAEREEPGGRHSSGGRGGSAPEARPSGRQVPQEGDTPAPEVRHRTGNWTLMFLFLLGFYAFASLARNHFVADGLGLNTWLYSLAALGAVSLAIRYGRAAMRGSSPEARF